MPVNQLPFRWWMAALVAWVAAFVLANHRPSPASCLERIEQQWKDIESEIRQNLQLATRFGALLEAANDHTPAWQQSLQTENPKPYSLWLFDTNDTLIWWSAAAIAPPFHICRSADSLGNPLVTPTADGWFACWQRPIDGEGRLVITLPLQKNEVLKLPKGWQLTMTPQQGVIHQLDGKALAYLKIPDDWRSPFQQASVTLLCLLSILLLVLGANRLCNDFCKTKARWQLTGTALLSALIAGGIFHSIYAYRGLVTDALFMPRAALPYPVGSLAHWVLVAILAIWLATVFHRSFQTYQWPYADTYIKSKSLVILLQLITGGMLCSFPILMQFLVKGVGPAMIAATVFELSGTAVLVMLIGLLFIISIFLTAHRMQSIALKSGTSLRFRMLTAICIAFFLVIALSAYIPHGPVIQYGLTIFLLLVAFDLYADQENPGLTWIIVWTGLITVFYSNAIHHLAGESLEAYLWETPVNALEEYSVDNFLTGTNLSGVPNLLALFSFNFILFGLLIGILMTLNYFIKSVGHPFNALKPSLRGRLQRYLIIFTLSAFVLIGWVTGSYFQSSTFQIQSAHFSENISYILQALQKEKLFSAGQLPTLAHTTQTNLWLFDKTGQLKQHATAWETKEKSSDLTVVPPNIMALPASDRRIYLKVPGLDLTYAPIRDTKGNINGYLGLLEAQDGKTGERLYFFLETLLNLYVFLLLAAGAVAIAMSDSISRPISQIGQKLSRLQLGKNEPLEWSSRDEIGDLVNQYNQMIEKLAQSAELLRKSEREGAWREMAKQVAHEIKNPLTPMKLSVQHLQMAAQYRPEEAPQLLARTTQTLLEQIDNLTHIANAFSNFAKMPAPETEVFAFDQLVASVHGLFVDTADNTTLQLTLAEAPVFVNADRNQLLRVVNNLVKNAIQAIPDEKPGLIQMALTTQNGTVFLQVTDNGTGIPDIVRDKVFYPNFTTKSSGMGLGLAMCKNIVEAAGGKIDFTTEDGEGTCFTVELPRVEVNKK